MLSFIKQWHRCCMLFTWTFTLIAFIMIFIDVDGWSYDEAPHAILGTITTILCFFHPILAMFRPNPGDDKRKYFNWGHWFGGNLAHILASKSLSVAVSKWEKIVADNTQIFFQWWQFSYQSPWKKLSFPFGCMLSYHWSSWPTSRLMCILRWVCDVITFVGHFPELFL